MKRRACILVCFSSLAAGPAWAGGGGGVWPDPAGDAVLRRTDSGDDGVLPPGFVPIDLLDVDVVGWTTPTPTSDPYSGSVDGGEAHLVMIRLRFGGVVSPPGPLGFGDAGGEYDPLRFGDRPVYGAIELDVDDRDDSGGELGDLGRLRYLANVARFGRTPEDLAYRAALDSGDLDSDFWSGPQYERSGADFAFVMCGCWVPTIVTQRGDGDGRFDAGETWIVGGRFFERAQSFAPECGTFGGSDFGYFDPEVEVRWSHSTASDETVVELVFPLTMAGAAMLTGEPQQSMNLSLYDHTSLAEAIDDLADSAENVNDPILEELMDRWDGRDWDDYIEPTEWRATALIGTAYVTPKPDGRYVWTDTGFGEVLGDADGDGVSGATDRVWAEDWIAANDGGPLDCGGPGDGSVTLCDFSRSFSVCDFDGDGVVNGCDALTLGRGADVNGDGVLDFFDVSAFLGWFSGMDPRADLNGDGLYEFFDIQQYLQVFSAGCR